MLILEWLLQMFSKKQFNRQGKKNKRDWNFQANKAQSEETPPSF